MTIIVGTDIIIHLAMEIIHFIDEREKKREEKEFLTCYRRCNQFIYE
jgi:hypothetical protein